MGSDFFPINPKLGPLRNNGGPVPTMALLAGSPALDRGHSGGVLTDARGGIRPVDRPSIANAGGGDGSDIGAFERDGLLRISGIYPVGDPVSGRAIVFQTDPGGIYTLQSTEVPGSGIWQNIWSNIPAGDGGPLFLVDETIAGVPKRFYRVRAED